MARGERMHLLVSNLRLAVMAGGAVMAWLAFSRDAIPATWMRHHFSGPRARSVHARVIGRTSVPRAHAAVPARDGRLDGRWTNTGRPHASSRGSLRANLDCLAQGPVSIASTVRTKRAKEALAVAPRPRRQRYPRAEAAVAELQPRAISGGSRGSRAEAHVGQTTALASWAAAPPAGLTARAAAVLAACAVISAVLIGAGMLEISAVGSGQPAPGRVTLSMIMGWLVIQVAVAALWRRKVGAALRAWSRGARSQSAHRLLQASELSVHLALMSHCTRCGDRECQRVEGVPGPLVRRCRQFFAQPLGSTSADCLVRTRCGAIDRGGRERPSFNAGFVRSAISRRSPVSPPTRTNILPTRFHR